jgi:hypothetical protein
MKIQKDAGGNPDCGQFCGFDMGFYCLSFTGWNTGNFPVARSKAGGASE